jgi:hypothetical protein
MLRLAMTAAAAMVLAGCQTDPNFYTRDDFRGEALSRMRVIDDGYCTMAANGATKGAPVAYVPSSSGGTSMVSGTYDGRPFSGTVTTYQSAAGAFANGFADGMAMGAAAQSAHAYRKIYRACMFANGWRDKNEADK